MFVIAAARLINVNMAGLYLFGFKWPIHCLLKHTFGIKCALCGMTHSFSAMARADLDGAFGFHRMGPVLFAFIILQVPYRIWAVKLSPKLISAKLRRAQMALTALILAAIFIDWLIYLGARLL